MDTLNEILQLGAYLAENPYAGVGVAAAVAGIIVAAKLASREDPDGPMVRRRTVGGVAMARHLNGAYRKRSRRWRGSRAHAFPALGKEYAGEFAAVFGGPGVGKTMRVVVPLLARRILEGRLSTVVLDTKGEVFDATLRLCGRRSGRPLIHLYSTLRKHPDELVSTVDPFADPASRANFLEAILPEPPGSDPTWNQRARTMIRAVCQALERTGRAADLPATYDVLKNPRALDELARRDSGAAGVWAGQDNRTHESVRTTALAPLEGLEDTRIRRVFDACRVAPRIFRDHLSGGGL
jgi:hypothetical protein